MVNSGLPTRVILNECWARDGLQNQSLFVDTSTKVKMIELLSDAGFQRIEATSFSHPKYVPQFRDAEEVLKRVKEKPRVSYKATCVNKHGLERAIKSVKRNEGPNEVSFVIAASEDYNKINVRMDQSKLLQQIDQMISEAKEHNLSTVVSIATAFGFQKNGDVKPVEVYNLVEYFNERKVDRISIGDTTGMANPQKAEELFTGLQLRFPDVNFIAHFHDTKGWGVANAYAALQTGVDHFDVSLGGVGGPPAKRVENKIGPTGNLCTEDFSFLLADLGIETDIDLQKLISLGKYSEEILGTQNSKYLHSINSN